MCKGKVILSTVTFLSDFKLVNLLGATANKPRELE